MGFKAINRPSLIARDTTHFSFFILKENTKTTLHENDFSVKRIFYFHFSGQLLHLGRDFAHRPELSAGESGGYFTARGKGQLMSGQGDELLIF